jgi:hypothetical protein
MKSSDTVLELICSVFVLSANFAIYEKLEDPKEITRSSNLKKE